MTQDEYNYWTPEEDKDFMELFHQGLNSAQIHAEMVKRGWNRSKATICTRKTSTNKLLAEGKSLTSVRFKWTDEVVATMERMLAEGSSWEGIVHAITKDRHGRLPSPKSAQAWYKKIHADPNETPKVLWSRQREDTLRKLVVEGLTSGQIGLVMGFSRSAITGKIHRLGLRLDKSVKPRVVKPEAPKDEFHDQFKGPKIPMYKVADTKGYVESSCQYMEGDDGKACGGKVVEGFSYCRRHCEICYVKFDERKVGLIR